MLLKNLRKTTTIKMTLKIFVINILCNIFFFNITQCFSKKRNIITACNQIYEICKLIFYNIKYYNTGEMHLSYSIIKKCLIKCQLSIINIIFSILIQKRTKNSMSAVSNGAQRLKKILTINQLNQTFHVKNKLRNVTNRGINLII